MSEALSAGHVSLTVVPDTSKFKILLRSAIEGEEGAVLALGKGLGSKLAEAIGGAIAAGAALSAKMAVEMGQADALIQGNAQITQKAATDIGDAMLKTAGQSTFSGHEMAKAFGPVAGVIQAVSGHALNQADAMKVMKASTDLAEASQGDLANTTAVLASVMRSYKIDAGGAADASNILFNVSRSTGLGLDSIAMAANKMHARLGEASPTLKDTGTLVLDLAQHGVTGTKSLMIMQAGITTLMSGGKVTNDVLKILGVTVYDSSGKFVGMRNVLAQLSPKLSGMTEEQRRMTEQALFGKSAAGALNDTLLAGAKGYDTASAAAVKKNAVDEAAKANAKTLEGQMKTLRGAVSDYATLIGEKVIPLITGVVTWFTKHKGVAIALAAVIGTVMVGALAVWTASVVANSVTVIARIALMVAGWFGLATEQEAYSLSTRLAMGASTKDIISATVKQIAALAVAGAKWVWSGVMALESAAKVAAAWLISIGPIALVIAAVVGLVVVVVKNWDKIKEVISKAVESVLNFVKTHWVLLVELITGPIGIVVIQIVKHWDAIKTKTGEAISAVIDFFKNLPHRILDALGDLGSLLLDSGKHLIEGLVKGIEAMAGKVFDATKNVVKGVLKHLKLGFLIQSPSKVTMTLGEQVMEGLAGGIDKGASKANAAASKAAKTVIAEHKKMVAELAKDNAEVSKLYASMHTVIADALKSRADLIKNANVSRASAQKSFNDASFQLHRTFNDDLTKLDRDYAQKKATLERTRLEDIAKIDRTQFDALKSATQSFNESKFKLDRDYEDKKATLQRTYNEALTSAQKTFDETTASDLAKHNQNLLDIQTSYAAKVVSLTQASADQQKAIVEKSRALLTDAFKGSTSLDVGSMFSTGTGVGGLLDSLQAKLSGAKDLATNAAALAGKGFSQTFIQEVVSQGASVGNEMAQSILDASPEATKQLQDLYAQINAVSAHGLDALASQMSTSTHLATSALTDEYNQVAVDLKASLAGAYNDLVTATNAENAAFIAQTVAVLKTLTDAKAAAKQTLDNALADGAKTYADSLFDMNTNYTDAINSAMDAHSQALADLALTNTNALLDASQTYANSLTDMNTTLTNGMFDASTTLKEAIKGVNVQFDADIAALQTSTNAKMDALQTKLKETAKLIADISGAPAGAKVVANAPKTPTLVTAPSSGSMDMATSSARAAAVASSLHLYNAPVAQAPVDVSGLAKSTDISQLSKELQAATAAQARLMQQLQRASK